MTRIVVGNRDGALALSQVRSVVAELTDEWPDINIVQKTIPAGSDGDTAALLGALERNQLSIALLSMERLPGTLPEGLTLASVTRRVEARSTLLGKGISRLSDLPQGARVGVPTERDALFLEAAVPGVESVQLELNLDANLKRMAGGELTGLILPISLLMGLERRSLIEETLEEELFPPACGQGSLGLVVREDDDGAMELAYTMQHRPSFDRVRAERSFQNALLEASADAIMQRGGASAIGAFANVTSDGELTLFGAVIANGGSMIQATSSGEASEAADIGQELAADFRDQLAQLG